MSENTAIPSVKQAEDLLLQQVQYPAFFEKLAVTWGIRPQSENEAIQMIKMAAYLRVVHSQEQEKSAAATGSFLDRAMAHLENNVQLGGVNVSQLESDEMYKQAAFEHVATDRDVAFAALAMAQAMTDAN